MEGPDIIWHRVPFVWLLVGITAVALGTAGWWVSSSRAESAALAVERATEAAAQEQFAAKQAEDLAAARKAVSVAQALLRAQMELLANVPGTSEESEKAPERTDDLSSASVPAGGQELSGKLPQSDVSLSMTEKSAPGTIVTQPPRPTDYTPAVAAPEPPAAPSVIPPRATEVVPPLSRLQSEVVAQLVLAERTMKSDSDNAYVVAGEIYRATLDKLEAFEQTSGASVQSRAMWEATAQNLDKAISKCNAENEVNRDRRAKTIPCPKQK